MSDEPQPSAQPAEPDPWGERLPRSLGAWSAMAVVVGSTIGSGIFASPAEIGKNLRSLDLFFLAWVLGAMVALAGALTLAELAAMFPRTGGLYVFIREAFGKLPAFLFGWAELLILRPAAYGAIAIVSSDYTWRVTGIAGDEVLFAGLTRIQALAIAYILIVGTINYRGIRGGALVQNVSTVLKMAALLTIVVLGFALVPGEVPPPTKIVAPDATGVAAFGLAMVSVLWAYDGWSDVGFVSGEIRNPQKTLPMAFIGGTAAVAVLYLLANAVYLRVVDVGDLAGRNLIAADVALALLGSFGAVFVSAAVAVSTFGTLNGSMMTGPRVFFAMAEDGLFFERLGRVHPRNGTPSGAIALSVGLGVLFASVSTFGELADQFVVGIWPFYALAVAAVFRLRKTVPDERRPYRTWGYPVVPLVFLAATVFLLGNYAINKPLQFGANVGVMLAGVPVYVLIVRSRRQRPSETP